MIFICMFGVPKCGISQCSVTRQQYIKSGLVDVRVNYGDSHVMDTQQSAIGCIQEVFEEVARSTFGIPGKVDPIKPKQSIVGTYPNESEAILRDAFDNVSVQSVGGAVVVGEYVLRLSKEILDDK